MSRSRSLGLQGLLVAGAVLSLALPALGKPGKRPNPDEPVTMPEELCPTIPPPVLGVATQWRIYRGESQSLDQAEAMDLARHNALSTAVQTACAGLRPWQCERVRRNLRPWRTGWFYPPTGTACQSVVVEAAYLNPDADMGQFEADMGRVAAAAAERADLLAISPPEWSSGCVARELGAPIALALRDLLAPYDVRLSDPESPAPEASVLRVHLAPNGEEVHASVELHSPAGDILPLGGLRFPADLFKVTGTLGKCRSDDDLGLEGGGREGADGRRVWVTVPTESGVYCEGDRVNPVLGVSRPSRVRVYSVSQDGDGFLVWPPPGRSDLVDAATELGDMVLVSLPDAGDERLVAMAIPEDGSFGATEAWQSFCKLPTQFSPELYPGGAAVGSATYTVIPQLTDDRCGESVEARRIQEMLQTAVFPVCGR